MTNPNDYSRFLAKSSTDQIDRFSEAFKTTAFQRLQSRLSSPPKPKYQIRLFPLLGVIVVILTVTVGVAVAFIFLAMAALHVQGFKHESKLSPANLYDLIKVGFALGAGAGAIVALITSYRRQRISELAERREGTRTFYERFARAAEQLGNGAMTVRLAGVHGIAGLADDWPEQRQACVDMLCAYLRKPYDAEPAVGSQASDRQAFTAEKEVRHTVIRVIAHHLSTPHTPRGGDWRPNNFDFAGVIFDGGSFFGAEFRNANFADARFVGGEVNFQCAIFVQADFTTAIFAGGKVDFTFSQFAPHRGKIVSFRGAQFNGSYVNFTASRFFNNGSVLFDNAKFADGVVNFHRSRFERGGGITSFLNADFSGAKVIFRSIIGDVPLDVQENGGKPRPGVILSDADEGPSRSTD